ncbi:hypothetical protein T4A_9628 [Trichinella pseudospiralis]|uniref:Uncharacterized protein n=1 Tax=Trichinella pseudospiralis TaxID=6337 RepID=A0A0V1K3B6_TRIPS|nr:hypothetical protein T4E_19 [Trichinella pseudospiralis]KRY71525.1 hypothetical protein T4A_9628 [Trichinella pseudospiralis]KRZ41560.1 hypothetical protein T4C_13746 [Trichinella pseudospiralis]
MLMPVNLVPAGFKILNVGASGQLASFVPVVPAGVASGHKIPLWNVYGLSVRTNNYLEDWHSRMNKKARKHHLGFY